MKNLQILTGPVHSGKTTKLMQWVAAQKNIDGILQPVINEKRFIYHLGSRTLKILETSETQPKDEFIIIGKYKFRKSVFDWAQDTLLNCLYKKLDWLIIDEIGPLELGGNGLEPAISKIFEQIDKMNGNVLCVVRNSLFNQFIHYYNLEEKFVLFKFDQK